MPSPTRSETLPTPPPAAQLSDVVAAVVDDESGDEVGALAWRSSASPSTLSRYYLNSTRL
jgi:hypothetical protein